MKQTAHDPRQAVIRRLAASYDRFADEEQVLVSEGKYAEAEGAHEACRIILRAYQAESDDPTPEGLCS